MVGWIYIQGFIFELYIKYKKTNLGNWKNGKRSGKGERRWVNGNIYKGKILYIF